MGNRLQFVHNNNVFKTREDAIYFLTNDYYTHNTRPSLYAEPVVLRYGDKANPNVILAIGATGEGSSAATDDSSYFIIDAQGLKDEIDDAKVSFKDTNTIKVTKADGVVSGDINVPDKIILGNEVKTNIIKVGKTGIESYVDLKFDNNTNTITFQVNDDSKSFTIPTIVDGQYDITKESLVFTYSDGSIKEINVSRLINELDVEGENSTTPIVLTREVHDKQNTDIYDRTKDQWHDILKADVRIDVNNKHNILKKTADGHALYVEGTADNISYDGKQSVKEKIDNSIRNNVAKNAKDNIIFRHYNNNGDYDGIYASVDLQYDGNTDTLTFYYSQSDGTSTKKEFKLNSTNFIDDFSYDTATKTLIIRYTDKNGVSKKASVPLKEILDDWVVASDGHNVALNKGTVDNGKDVLTADVKLSDIKGQILSEVDHRLYVRGSADNIKYDLDENATVKDVLDSHTENINKINTAIGDSSEGGSISSKLDTINSKLSENDKNIENINGRIDGVQKAAGITSDGYSTDSNDEVLSGATSLKDADTILSKAIKTLKDGISDFKKIFISKVNGEETSTAKVKVTDAAEGEKSVKVDIKLANDQNGMPNLIKIIDNEGIYFDGSIDYGVL